jgi:NRAMP (natural resistance-associated macrophage protein)-like metal ion transporter
MIAVQECCARIGSVTGQGLVKVTSRIYSKRVVYGVVVLVVIANVINIGADIAAIGSALNLLIPLPVMVLSTISVVIILALEIFVGYHTYSKYLKLLALTLISYVITAIIVNPNWTEVVKSFFIPKISWTADYWYVIVALIGTTISPYMFFWQAAEEVEERKYSEKIGKAARDLKTIRRDTSIGMTASQLGSMFMIITTAVVLNQNGVTSINTASDAAKALEPLVSGSANAGLYAKIIFAIGIIGMGLLGIPVLAGSVAYAVSDVRGWRQGLDYKFSQAKAFYAVIVLATFAGWLMNLIGIDPIKGLVFAAVINGLVSIPLIFLLMKISQNSELLGANIGGRLSKAMLMATFFVTSASGLILIFATLRA